jgi:hypothetical protein
LSRLSRHVAINFFWQLWSPSLSILNRYYATVKAPWPKNSSAKFRYATWRGIDMAGIVYVIWSSR